MEKKIINIGEKSYRLIFDQFDDSEVDIDELLKIDYSNLIGEIVTFPVIVNRFGLLLAECESKLSEAKLNLDVLEAKIKERLRKELMDDKGKSPTIDTLNNAMVQENSYQVMKKRVIEVQKT